MTNIDEIARILHDFKESRHKKNDRIVLGGAPEMDTLFANFCESARKNFADTTDTSGVFCVLDNTKLARDDEPKRVSISRSDVLMMIDDSDSRGFKLFGKHKELPGQFGILFTKKGVVSLNRPDLGFEGGFISWEGFRFCSCLLADMRRSEREDYDTDAYPGKFVFMLYGCGLESDELYENVTKKIMKLLGCNRDWVDVVKRWHGK